MHRPVNVMASMKSDNLSDTFFNFDHRRPTFFPKVPVFADRGRDQFNSLSGDT